MHAAGRPGQKRPGEDAGTASWQGKGDINASLNFLSGMPRKRRRGDWNRWPPHPSWIDRTPCLLSLTPLISQTLGGKQIVFAASTTTCMNRFLGSTGRINSSPSSCVGGRWCVTFSWTKERHGNTNLWAGTSTRQYLAFNSWGKTNVLPQIATLSIPLTWGSWFLTRFDNFLQTLYQWVVSRTSV